MMRRVSLPALLSLLVSVTLAGSVFAGGGGLGGPGVFHFSDAFAVAELASQDSSVFIDVDHGSLLINRRDGSGVTMQNGTILQIGIATPTLFGFGCYTIPDSAFTIAPALQTATLQVTLPAGPPSLFGGTASEVKAPGSGVGPLAGGGGGGGGCFGGNGFPTSLTVSATWTSNGFVANFMDQGTFRCQDASIDQHLTSAQTHSTVQVSLSTVTIPAGFQSAAIATSSADLNVMGTPSILCFI